jgi:hypothetical protein
MTSGPGLPAENTKVQPFPGQCGPLGVAMHIPTRRVDDADLDRMNDALCLPGTKKRSEISQFWIPLIQSEIIASAGVGAVSTATVTGAVIVAPLMTPIIGTALALVPTDRMMRRRSVALIILGATSVIVIGVLSGVSDLGDIAVEAIHRVVVGSIQV